MAWTPRASATRMKAASSGSQCSAVLFAHVPKTGGSTLEELFCSVPGWLSLSRPNSGHATFLAMVPEVFADRVPLKWLPRACRPMAINMTRYPHTWGSACGIPDRRITRVYLGFHEPPGRLHFRVIMDRIEALRRAYSADGCALQVGTVLREPAGQTLSMFTYFGLTHRQLGHVDPAKLLGVVYQDARFSQYLTDVANPQLGWLRQDGVSSGCDRHVRWCSTPRHTPCGPDGSAEDGSEVAHAKAVLGAFDVVGVTSGRGDGAVVAGVDTVFWLLMARVGHFFSVETTPGHGAPATHHVACNPPRKQAWVTLAQLSNDSRALLANRTRCDEQLFALASRRAAAEAAFASELVELLQLKLAAAPAEAATRVGHASMRHGHDSIGRSAGHVNGKTLLPGAVARAYERTHKSLIAAGWAPKAEAAVRTMDLMLQGTVGWDGGFPMQDHAVNFSFKCRGKY